MYGVVSQRRTPLVSGRACSYPPPVSIEPAPPLAGPTRAATVSPVTIALRLTCALVLTLTALVSLTLQGRPATSGELIEDAQAGRVTRMVVTDDSVIWWVGEVRPWETPTPVSFDGRTYYSDQVGDLLGRYAFREHIEVVRRSARLPDPLRLLAVGGGLVAFLLLIGGPEPARANRWAWFWLSGVGRTFSVGAIAFLLLSGPVRGVHRPPERRERWDGAKGFGMAILLSIALFIVWTLVRHIVWPASDGTASYVTRPA